MMSPGLPQKFKNHFSIFYEYQSMTGIQHSCRTIVLLLSTVINNQYSTYLVEYLMNSEEFTRPTQKNAYTDYINTYRNDNICEACPTNT